MENPAQSVRADLPVRHIPELDGVRALAIWLVLASHLFDTDRPDPTPIFLAPVRGVIHHGYLGVDLFFVLSGFLITGILLRTKHLGTREFFKRFYTRRILRIFPLYFLVLGIICLIAGAAALPFFGLGALLAANLSSVFHIAVPSSAGPFWSLAVEEQFYLIWPWLVLWLPRRALVAVSVSILVIEPILRLVAPGNTDLTWYHSDGLAMGSLMAVLMSRYAGDKRAVLRIAYTLVAVCAIVTIVALPYHVFGDGRVATGLRTWQADTLFGALVAVSIGFSGAPALAFLRTPIAKTTATLSYCIYIIHRGLIDLYGYFAPRVFPASANFSSTETSIVRGLFVIAFAYAIAALSWRYFESPLLRRGR